MCAVKNSAQAAMPIMICAVVFSGFQGVHFLVENRALLLEVTK